MPCAKFGWNWPSGFEEEDFFFTFFTLHFTKFGLYVLNGSIEDVENALSTMIDEESSFELSSQVS